MQGNTPNGSVATEATTAALSTRHAETMAQLNRTVAQAEDLLRALGDESGQAIDAMRERVSATLQDARSRLAGQATHARQVATDSMTRADAYVHENPWRAVAIGVGLGALAAMLLSSSRHTRNSMHGSALE